MPRHRPPANNKKIGPIGPNATPLQFQRWLIKFRHQRQSRSPTDAEQAEKLNLAKLLLLTKLTRIQTGRLVKELLRFWFPKEWAALKREVYHQETAEVCQFMIRHEAAKSGCSIADAKRKIAKWFGFQSVEAMERRIKRARQVKRRYGSVWSSLEWIEKRVQGKTKRDKKL
jgi:hypothetical protein